MKTQAQAIGIAVLLMVFGIPLAILLTAQAQKTNNPAQQNPASDAYKLSGPYTHDNLTIFLVHGKDTITNRNILTLQEAMEQKKVIVHETQDVNELAIENVSRDADVFVQSGDIVKGGQQDRMLAVDLIVPPRSGRVKIAAFCVESGRWSKRGNEESTKFTASSDRVATKDLKVAANRTNAQQSEVWNKVGEAQVKLSSNVGGSVNNTQSVSSLQLSLEDQKVKQTTDAYLKTLSQVIAGKQDVIGYAFAINGQINSADVYASSTLFKKLWPKLLKATAVEAVAEKQKDQKFEQAKEADVQTFFAAAQTGKASENNVNGRTKMVTRETEEHMLLESRDMKQKEAWVHRSYIKLK